MCVSVCGCRCASLKVNQKCVEKRGRDKERVEGRERMPNGVKFK